MSQGSWRGAALGLPTGGSTGSPQLGCWRAWLGMQAWGAQLNPGHAYTCDHVALGECRGPYSCEYTLSPHDPNSGSCDGSPSSRNRSPLVALHAQTRCGGPVGCSGRGMWFRQAQQHSRPTAVPGSRSGTGPQELLGQQPALWLSLAQVSRARLSLLLATCAILRQDCGLGT